MKTTFDDFIKANPNCGKFAGCAEATLIFEFLSRDSSIIKMAEACDAGKPAITPVAAEIEDLLSGISNATISFENNFTKQAVGLMVKSILTPFGYVVTTQKNLPKAANAKQFVSASCYAYRPQEAHPTMRIVKHIEEIQ